MEEHTLGAGFYAVTVGVCKTDRLLYDSIDKTIEVPAQIKNHYGDLKECIYPPGLNAGLFPGVWCGMWIISASHAKRPGGKNYVSKNQKTS